MVSGAAAPHKLVLQMPVEAAGAVPVVPWVWWWHEEMTEPLPCSVCLTQSVAFSICALWGRQMGYSTQTGGLLRLVWAG